MTTKEKKRRKEKKQQEEDNKKIGLEVGQSALQKHKGRGTIVKFKIIQGKEEIEPWKGKDADVMEWMRNSSAMLGDRREEYASFWKKEEDDIYYEDSQVPNRKMMKAYFASEVNGRPYDVAARLLDKNIKIGDRVKLTIMGCCSVIDVEKVKEEEEVLLPAAE